MNRQPKLLGLDLGFGYTKCLDGEQSIIFASLARPDIRQENDTRGHPDGARRVMLDGNRLCVGDDTGSPSLFEHFACHPKRLIHELGRTLMLTAIAPFSEQECPLHVVLGLPLTSSRLWGAELSERLTGYHKITMYEADGSSIPKNIHIRKLHIVPHPLGTYTSLIMDATGAYRDSDYNTNKVAIVDVGFRHTDIMVMEAKRFCNRGSGTIEMGIAGGFEIIAHRLKRETGQTLDLDRLYKAIRMGFIRIDDQEYNLNNLREETYQHLSGALADRINYALKDDWDLERVVLTGGGASDLADTLASLIDGEVVLIEHDEDVRLGNVQGQLTLARHMWGTSGYCDVSR